MGQCRINHRGLGLNPTHCNISVTNTYGNSNGDGRGRSNRINCGAVASGFISWNTQRMQAWRELTQQRLRERQTLYGEFITEASRLVVDAVSHSLETPEKLVILYGILGRIWLVSSGKVLPRQRSFSGRSSTCMSDLT